MDNRINITYLVLDGHVEVHRYRHVYFTVVLMVYVLIVCSNSTIVYLIYKHQDLHEPMYVFIAALLLNSVFISTNVYPKLLMDFLSERQVISYQACLGQYFLFYTFGGSEFLLLAAMAYDRYVSICKPLHYQRIMSRAATSLLVAVSWLLPAFQLVALTVISWDQKLCSFTLNVIYCNNSLYKLFCVTLTTVTVLGLWTLTSVVVFPVIFIIFTYTKIFTMCYFRTGAVRKKAAQTCLPHLLVLFNYFFWGSFDVITVRLDSDLSKTARLILSLQLILFNPLFNPIIYGLKMKEITKHLKRFFF